jgi:hypothetical protein
MSELAGVSSLAPPPEQLAEWHAMVERVRQGDESEIVSWDEIALELGL